MFDKPSNYDHNILFKSNNDMFIHLTKYIATFDSIKDYNAISYQTTVENDSEPIYSILLGAPYGNYNLYYKDNIMNINYQYESTIVGSYDKPQIYEYLYLSCNNLQLIKDFVEDARLFSLKPLDNNDTTEFVSVYQFNSSLKRWALLSKLKKRESIQYI